MILTLDEIADDFKRFLHASIIDKRYYQDVYYLGNIYRIRIKHHKYAPNHRQGSKYPPMHRTKRIPPSPIEVSKCFTCGGPAVGPVCMYKGCEDATGTPPPVRI